MGPDFDKVDVIEYEDRYEFRIGTEKDCFSSWILKEFAGQGALDAIDNLMDLSTNHARHNLIMKYARLRQEVRPG